MNEYTVKTNLNNGLNLTHFLRSIFFWFRTAPGGSVLAFAQRIQHIAPVAGDSGFDLCRIGERHRLAGAGRAPPVRAAANAGTPGEHTGRGQSRRGQTRYYSIHLPARA